MSDTIQVDYQALRKIAQKFEEQHQKMHRLAHELTHTVQNLKRGGWISDAANDFYRDMDNNLLPRLNRLERALHSSAAKTEEIGRIMRGGEEEATGSVKSTGGGMAGIANAIKDIMNNGGIGGAIGGAVGDFAADNNESGDPIGGGEGAVPGDGSVSNASEGGVGTAVGEAAAGVFENGSGGGIGESIGNAANQVLQNGGGGMGAAGAAASGVVDEVLKNAGGGGLAGGGAASGGGGGGGSSSGGGGAGSSVNTTGQGEVIRSVDMSNPTEAPNEEVSGLGSASAFGGAPADGA